MPISDDAMAIAAAALTQAHAASMGAIGSKTTPEQRVKDVAWAYRQYLEVVRNHDLNPEPGAPIE